MRAERGARAAGLILVGVLLLVAQAERARACDCLVSASNVLAPADGAVEVPRNARVWLGTVQSALAPGAPSLRATSGDVVPTASTRIDGAAPVMVLTPEEPLSPGASYEVVHGEVILSSFTVGDIVDDEPPPLPRMSIARVQSGLLDVSCGGFSRPESFVALDVVHEGVLAVLDRGGGEALDPAAPSGSVTTATAGARAILGDGDCATGWPGAGAFASATVRAGAFDVAGNFSGFDEGTLVVFPPPGCACAEASPPRDDAPTAALLSLCVFAGILRRGGLMPRRTRARPRAARRLCRAVFAALVLLSSGCGRPPPESYDASCEIDADCRVVAVPTCAPCASCGDLAIRADEVARFDREQEIFCVYRQPAACGACPDLQARCEQGACAMRDCSVEDCTAP